MADNPANTPSVDGDNRIPMSMPQLMLQVPEIPGYVMHWFADRPGRISRALSAGYEFVTPDEVRINNFSYASDLAQSGNTDLGTRVSVHGGTTDTGAAERLYLMKVRQEWYDKDMKIREEASDKVVEALKSGMVGVERDNPATRYLKKRNDNLFTKHKQPG